MNALGVEDRIWDSAQFLEKVTSVVPDIIYVFNQKTQSNEYSNRSLPETLGYSNQEVREMGDSLMAQICHPDDLPLIGAHFEAIRQLPDGERKQLEYRIRHRSGRYLWLLSVDTVFERDDNGDVIRHIGTATDITTMKEAELARQAAATALEKHGREIAAANAELVDFAYAASHDLKAPINTLRLLIKEIRTELGEDHELSETLITPGLAVADRARALIDDILGYTRVIGQDLDHEPVDLTQLAQDAVADLQGQIDDVEITIAALPTVSGNPVQLRLLMNNLVSNAIKFRRPGTGHRVDITPTEADPGQTGFVVSDNGVGIPEAHRDRIFDMFQRLHLASDFSGTGLGLTICRRVVLNHDGAITVDSSVDHGTSFTVTLPDGRTGG